MWPLKRPLALSALSGKLMRPTNRFGFFARTLFRRFLIGAPALHFTEESLALHLFFQCAKGLIDIVVANEYLDQGCFSFSWSDKGLAPFKAGDS